MQANGREQINQQIRRQEINDGEKGPKINPNLDSSCGSNNRRGLRFQ